MLPMLAEWLTLSCLCDQTLIVRNMLNPLCAVLIMTPVSWGCQCTSLMSVCPWWINNNCGGTSGSVSSQASFSFSTARSHKVIWSSDPEAPNTVLSEGCHSTDVMGAVWCLNNATGLPFWSKQTMDDESSSQREQYQT